MKKKIEVHVGQVTGDRWAKGLSLDHCEPIQEVFNNFEGDYVKITIEQIQKPADS
jgi:hypothetical protein